MTPMALRLPVRAQLLLLGLAVGLPAAALFTWHAWETAHGAREAAYAQVTILADTTAAQLDNFLADQEAILSRAAERPLVRALDPARCDPAILQFAGLHAEFVSLGVRDATGRVICTSNRQPARIDGPGQVPWFDEALRTPGLSAGDAFLSPAGRWISVLTHPVRRDDGRVAGIVGLPLDLLRFQERLFRASPAEAEIIVADRGRNVLMRSTEPAAWVGKPLAGEFSALTRNPVGRVVAANGPDGVARLYAVATVPRSGWQVMAGLPEESVLAAYRAERNRHVATSVAMLAAVLAVAWWAGTTLARPIVALGRTAGRVAAGETQARAAVTGPAELEEVARQFNRMLEVRESLREERAALVGHFGTLARLAREVILLVDPDGNIVEANDAAVRAYGWSANELRGMHIRELRPEDQRADVDARWAESARPGGVLFETVHRRRDGTTFPVEVSSSVIDIAGRPWRQSFIRDISERHAARRQLERLATAYATLSETNQAIVRATDEPGMLRRVCQIAVEFGGYPGAWIGFVDARSGEVVVAASHGKAGAEPASHEAVRAALRTGLPRFGNDAIAALPLRRGGAVTGVLALRAPAPGAFDDRTRALLEEMAVDVSFALDNFDRKAALAEWAGRYEATVRASGQLLLDRDLATGAMKVAGDALRILGWREDELSGDAGLWTGIVHPEDRARFAAEIARAGRDGLPFHLQYRVRRRDGETLVVQDDGYAVRDAAGHVARMVGFVADITERKLADDRIRSQLEELRRWHTAMLGREVRVLQLKREVNEALAAAGRPPRYESPRAGREEAARV
ncbi:MAG: PAS domain S-box protein [Burkholderiales bacterium]|nr:PAS domain S-box protein [Burkholderiales bacterium]